MFRIHVLFLLASITISCSLNKKYVLEDSLFSKIETINTAIVKDPEVFHKNDSLCGDLFLGVHRNIPKNYFEKSFSFIGERNMKELYKLLKKDKITEISLKNVNHISYRLIPKQNNYLFKLEWDVIRLVYDTDNCDRCLNKRGLSDSNNSIEKLKENWYKVTFKKKRYIGG